MNVFFTSDFHLNHDNIRKYCKRPFNSLEEMNSVIIRNHNSRVKNGDLVMFLGDFCFKNSKGGKLGEGLPQKAEDLIKLFNGNFVFIKGNHDRNNSLKTPIEKVIINYGGYRICLVHNPEHIDLSRDLNFVGHIHEKWKFKEITKAVGSTYLINVGVDMWNFRPITFQEIMRDFNKWKKKKNNTQNIPEKKGVKNSLEK